MNGFARRADRPHHGGSPIRRILILGALTGAVLVSGPAHAHPICHGKPSCPELVAARHCDRGFVKSCIRRAAIHRRVDVGQALRIAYRESRLNPRATNSSSAAAGIYQFLWSTWRNTPYSAHSPYAPKWAALAYAWAISRGYASWWSLTCC